MILSSYVPFVPYFAFNSKKMGSEFIKCTEGNGNHTTKMADTDNFPEIDMPPV